jgi:hypothetical protein
MQWEVPFLYVLLFCMATTQKEIATPKDREIRTPLPDKTELYQKIYLYSLLQYYPFPDKY